MRPNTYFLLTLNKGCELAVTLEGFPELKVCSHSRTQAKGVVFLFCTLLMEECRNAGGHPKGGARLKFLASGKNPICSGSADELVKWPACQRGSLGNKAELQRLLTNHPQQQCGVGWEQVVGENGCENRATCADSSFKECGI